MFYSSLLVALFVSFSVVLGLKEVPKFTNIRKNIKSLFSTIDANDLPGVLPPTGFFDPIRLSANVSEETLKRWREAEIKHGRVSMLVSFNLIFVFNQTKLILIN